jgi:hypothetical protein
VIEEEDSIEIEETRKNASRRHRTRDSHVFTIMDKTFDIVDGKETE